MIEKFAPLKQPDYNKIFNALIQNLMPVFAKNVGQEFFQGKLETFLTCRQVSEILRENILDESSANFFEELSLKAIQKTLYTNITPADLQLLIAELPKILPLNYPIVKDIREICIDYIPQLMHIYRVRNDWTTFTELDYTLNMLKIFKR